MTTKKPSLAAALRQKSEPKDTMPISTRTEPAEAIVSGNRTTTTAPNRIGKKSITGWFDAEVLKQLKMIGLEHDMSIQQMVGDALNDFFAKHGKSQIAK
ncbi:hypothetical protein FP507_10675 (plasmid) [Chlorobium phaeovibrioides]|uniref:Antitoxin-like ribbon-helix-helix domain-containing protein n=1 Tax=Chlorobium phaeovibrioides TaxID=1094 RepID=A0A5M8I4S4_CHLPH|nr:ribbon-helix-helix domain-containing protein [Chlorobium phaeovibrioides]KAA6230478.1 hypothetical protein FP507_10675 [Chlorobium phaeovibrioides]MDT9547315.1 hypothetical protein [Chlorobium phaeovibrioides]